MTQITPTPKPILFQSLCDTLEALDQIDKQTKQTKQDKSSKIEQFVRTLDEPNWYPTLRLLAPHLDKERGAYELKEVSIGKLYVDALSLKSTTQSQVLLDAKNGTKSKAGWYSDKIYEYLSKQGWKSDLTTKMTILEINAFLDQLAQAPKRDKGTVYSTIIPKCNALEQKWLIRIILRDLHIGMGGYSLLEQIHDHAVEVYATSNSLREVSKCFDKNYKGAKGLAVFSPISPMLAQVIKIKDEMFERRLVVETKFDGERCMIHYSKTSGIPIIKYFSRRSFETTNQFNKFDPVIISSVNARECILDGEMLLWDDEANNFRVYYGSREKNLPDDNTNKWNCFVAFDILYWNGEDLRGLPFEHRRKKYLEVIVKQVPNKFFIPKLTTVTSREQITAQLTIAGELNHEGIMIKDLDSHYKVGQRNHEDWMKLKFQYLADTFDLVIIGAAYGSKKKLTRFLLGLKKRDGDTDVYWPFIYSGSGLSDEEKQILETSLKWNKWTGRSPAGWGGWIPSSDLRPDFWIDPKDSKLLEVRALDIITTDSYMFDVTLRSPVSIKIRSDKECPGDCNDLDHVLALKEQSKSVTMDTQKVTKRGGGGKRKTLSVLDYINYALVDLKSRLFEKKIFVILYYDEKLETKFTRSAFDLLIKENSGEIEANLVTGKQKEGVIVIGSSSMIFNTFKAGHLDRLKQRNNIGYEYDVILPSYVTQCIDEGFVLEISPEFLLYRTPKTNLELKYKFDRYDDSFTTPATFSSLFKSMERVGVNKDDSAGSEFLQEYFPRVFDRFVVFADHFESNLERLSFSPLDRLENIMLSNGAQVIGPKDVTMFEKVTHVVIDGKLKSITNKDLISTICTASLTAIIVKDEWVSECVTVKKLIDSTQYLISKDLYVKRRISNTMPPPKKTKEIIEIL